eukprot:PITA_26093
MTGDKNKFISLKEGKGGTMSFGNDESENIIGTGTVRLGGNDVTEKDMLFIENMNHSLLTVYIEQPEGFLLTDKKDYVFRLKKALYGLKQAPRAWYACLDKYFQKQGFKRGNVDSNLYVKVEHDSLTIIEIYVNDIIFGSDDDRLSTKFASDMQSDFEMSLLGELTFFLGLQISQVDKGIFICQTKYINEMLKRFQMEKCKPVSTPMVTSCKLSIDDISKDADQRMYRSMIGNLLYVTSSRPDVMRAVGQVAHFQAAPKESHVVAVKRIFRYLKGTTNFGLWYPKGNNLIITTYTDADWASSIDDHKSISGATFYLGGCLVSVNF